MGSGEVSGAGVSGSASGDGGGTGDSSGWATSVSGVLVCSSASTWVSTGVDACSFGLAFEPRLPLMAVRKMTSREARALPAAAALQDLELDHRTGRRGAAGADPAAAAGGERELAWGRGRTILERAGEACRRARRWRLIRGQAAELLVGELQRQAAAGVTLSQRLARRRDGHWPQGLAHRREAGISGRQDIEERA